MEELINFHGNIVKRINYGNKMIIPAVRIN